MLIRIIYSQSKFSGSSFRMPRKTLILYYINWYRLNPQIQSSSSHQEYHTRHLETIISVAAICIAHRFYQTQRLPIVCWYSRLLSGSCDLKSQRDFCITSREIPYWWRKWCAKLRKQIGLNCPWFRCGAYSRPVLGHFIAKMPWTPAIFRMVIRIECFTSNYILTV